MGRVSKKGAGAMNHVIVHLILVGIIFVVFLFATADKINARGVHRQVIEKELALLVDSAVPGMEFEIRKSHPHGIIQKIEIKDGRIFVTVKGLGSVKGYPFFSKYSVEVVDEGIKFVVTVSENE